MKKFLASFLAFSLVFLSGCTRKDTGATPQTTPTQVEKKQLVIYNLVDSEEAFKGQIQAYESSHKDLDIIYKKFQNPEEYQKLVLNELAEGKGPDIFAIRNDWLPAYQGKIVPAPANVFIPEKFREIFLSVAADDLIRPDINAIEQVWGVPLFIDTLAIYYNKQLFRDNLPSSNKPAATWNDLEEQVFGLTKSDNSIERFSVSGMAMGLAGNISEFPSILALLLVQEGTDLFDASGQKAIFSRSKGVSSGSGKPFFPALEALNLYTSFAIPSTRYASWNLSITGLYPEQKEVGAFARGKVAMIFGLSGMYDTISATIGSMARSNETTMKTDDIGIEAVPQFDGSAAAGKRDALAQYFPFVVSRNSKLAPEAWAFLEFLSSADSLNAYHEKTNKPSSRLDMIEEQATEKTYGIFAQQAPYAKSLQTIDPDSFYSIFAKVNDAVVKNQLSAEAAIQKAEKQMDCVLAKQKNPELADDCLSL